LTPDAFFIPSKASFASPSVMASHDTPTRPYFIYSSISRSIQLPFPSVRAAISFTTASSVFRGYQFSACIYGSKKAFNSSSKSPLLSASSPRIRYFCHNFLWYWAIRESMEESTAMRRYSRSPAVRADSAMTRRSVINITRIIARNTVTSPFLSLCK